MTLGVPLTVELRVSVIEAVADCDNDCVVEAVPERLGDTVSVPL